MQDKNRDHLNEKFYSDFIRQHKDLGFSIALKITGNISDSEEIVQDAFVNAFYGLKNFDNRSKISTWFYKIVYNTAISKVRKKKITFSRIDIKDTEKHIPVQLNEAINNMDYGDRKKIVKQVMKKLDDLDYTILTLYYYEDKTLKEIASILNKDKNYMKVLIQRARRKFYKLLNESTKKELKEYI